MVNQINKHTFQGANAHTNIHTWIVYSSLFLCLLCLLSSSFLAALWRMSDSHRSLVPPWLCGIFWRAVESWIIMQVISCLQIKHAGLKCNIILLSFIYSARVSFSSMPFHFIDLNSRFKCFNFICKLTFYLWHKIISTNKLKPFSSYIKNCMLQSYRIVANKVCAE